MSRLPTLGADLNNWGTVLNDYLSQEHNSDATHKIKPRQPADYVISVVGGTCYARNGETGANDYSGSDAGAVLTSVISALGSSGGIVWFKADTYTWSTIPALPPNLTGWLKLIAEPGAVITLSSGAPRFLDLGKLANGDTFRYLWIEGFTIDGSGFSPSGHHHVVVGTYRGSSGTTSGENVNLDRIVIRRIRTVGLGVDLVTATNEQLNIWLEVYQNAASLPQNTLTNILIEQCDFQGGNYGVAVLGGKNGTWTGEPNILIDNLTIRDIRHDCGSDPTSTGSYAHVHVGDHAPGGTVWIQNIWGHGSHDVGVEVDNFMDAHVKNVYCRNNFGFVIAITNYQAPSFWQRQAYYIEDVTLERNAGSFDSDASSIIGIIPVNNTGGVQQPFGRVFARNLKAVVDGTSLPDINTDRIVGDLLDLTHSPLEVSIDGATYYAQNMAQTSTVTGGNPNVIYSSYNSGGGGQVTKLTLRNIDIVYNGTNGAGAQPTTFVGAYLSGQLNLLMENVSVYVNVTTPGTNNLFGVKLGPDANSIIRGTIRNLRIMGNNDTGGRGIAVYGSATLTVPTRIDIIDCDFTGMSGGTEVNYGGLGDNNVKTFLSGIKWRTNPRAPVSLTVPGSGTGQQWTGGYSGLMVVTGGTVTVVAVSRDNATYYTVGGASPVSVPLNHTDYYRFTYSVAPTAVLIPAL